jgi:hypothetical protein
MSRGFKTMYGGSVIPSNTCDPSARVRTLKAMATPAAILLAGRFFVATISCR